jgi:hypothetical protein
MEDNSRKKSDQQNSSGGSKPKKKELRVEIDLPGQPIQCWTTDVDKVTVILKKHRDVVFDVDMSAGKTYTVWSEMSEMYDPKAKKLLHPRETISFKDGDLLHLWIARNFQGKIYLYEGINLIGAYDVKKLDPSIESLDSAFKPAPINIVVKSHKIFSAPKTFNVVQADGSYSTPQVSSEYEHENFLQVVEITAEPSDMPKDIADFFKHGGEKEIMLSGGVVTSNWIMNQLVAQVGYLNDNRDWIKELYKEKITLKSIDHANGKKVYVILTGLTRVRRKLTAARYSATNTKVLAFTFGAGSANGLRHGSWAAVKGNASGAGRLAMLFTVTLDIAEWLADYQQRDPVTGIPKQDVADLFIKVGIDVAKNLINSVITNCIAWWLLGFVGGAPIIAIIVGTMVISLIVNATMDYLDKRFGISEKIALKIKDAPSLLESLMQKDYGGFKKAIDQAIKFGGFDDDYSIHTAR